MDPPHFLKLSLVGGATTPDTRSAARQEKEEEGEGDRRALGEALFALGVAKRRATEKEARRGGGSPYNVRSYKAMPW